MNVGKAFRLFALSAVTLLVVFCSGLPSQAKAETCTNAVALSTNHSPPVVMTANTLTVSDHTLGITITAPTQLAAIATDTTAGANAIQASTIGLDQLGPRSPRAATLKYIMQKREHIARHGAGPFHHIRL